MIRRIIKILLLLAFGLVLCCGLALAALDWYLGSDTLRQQAASFLEERIGLAVVIEGDLGVSVYPWLGIETQGVRISQPDGFGDGELARAEAVTARLSLAYLLEREIHFDVVAVRGLRLHLIRQNETTNLDRLLRYFSSEGGEPISLEWHGFDLATHTVRGLRLDDCLVRLEDRDCAEEVLAEHIRLRTGTYRPGEPLDISLNADVSLPGQDVSGSFSFLGALETDQQFTWVRIPESTFQCTFVVPWLTGNQAPGHATAQLALDTRDESIDLRNFKLKVPELLVNGDIRLENAWSEPSAYGHIGAAHFMVRETINHYAGRTVIPDKDDGIFGDASLRIVFRADAHSLDITSIDAACDETRLTGSFSVDDIENPVYRFDVTGDNLDFDRYYRLFIVDEPFVLSDFGPEFLGSVQADGRVRLGDVLLAGERFSDFVLTARAGQGELAFAVPSAGIWDGKAQAEAKISVRMEEDQSHPLAFSGYFEAKGADAAELPLLASESRSFSGRGSVRCGFDMPETVFRKDTNIDEVLRYTSLDLRYELNRGVITTRAEQQGEKNARTPFDHILAQAKLTADRKARPGREYGYKVGASVTAASKKEDYDLSARTNGTLTVSSGLDAAVLADARTGVQFTGSALPPGERTIVLGGILRLDTASQMLHVRELKLEGKAGHVSGELTGHRVFEDDFTWGGPLRFELDPRRAFGLVDVEIGETRDKKVLRSFSGKFDLALTQNQAVLSNIDATFDDTHGTGILRIESFETGHSTFQLIADELDINRYRPPRVIRDKEKCLEPPVEPVRLPLVTFSTADIDGDVRVGRLKVFDLSFDDVTAHLTAKGGQLSIPNLASGFYGGRVNGTFSGTATRQALDCDVKLRAQGFDGGRMMVDVSGKRYVDGATDIFFDVTTTADTDDAFLANMSGRAGVSVTNGSYRFSGQQNPPKDAKPTENIANNRTKFDGVAALFRVVSGRFISDDFRMESTYLTAEGGGNFDLDRNTIDVSIDAHHSLVPTVIPIHIFGCLHDPGVSIPSVEIIGNTLREILGLPLKPFQYLRDLFF
ncbi:MAG: AsmA family protein [Desulfovibrionaceae bacterium]